MIINKGKVYPIKKNIPSNLHHIIEVAQPKPIYDFIENELGLVHLYDNVSEIVLEEGIAMGLNFQSSSKEDNLKTIKYTKANSWLGFRIVREVGRHLDLD